MCGTSYILLCHVVESMGRSASAVNSRLTDKKDLANSFVIYLLLGEIPSAVRYTFLRTMCTLII